MKYKGYEITKFVKYYTVNYDIFFYSVTGPDIKNKHFNKLNYAKQFINQKIRKKEPDYKVMKEYLKQLKQKRTKIKRDLAALEKEILGHERWFEGK